MSKLRLAVEAVVAAESMDELAAKLDALREALREDELAEMQALTESEYREDALVCLSETHQQLGAELMELNKKPSTLWEMMKLDDEWKARLETAVLDEREACARICRDLGRGHDVAFAEFDCVEAIRARGEVSPKIGEQFGEQFGEEYELIGTIDGTYAGRWMIAVFAETASAVWPDNTAVYVRRKK